MQKQRRNSGSQVQYALQEAIKMRLDDRRTIVYLVNQYPKGSHSFIRREIQALERLGLSIKRVSLRRVREALVDRRDIEESRKTTYILESGLSVLLTSVALAATRSPRGFWRSVRQLRQFSKRSGRPLWIHAAYLMEACWLANYMRRIGARHLHAHFGTNPAEVAVYANLMGCVPYSVTIHGYDEFDHPEALGLLTKIELATFVVAISSFTRSQLMRWCRTADWRKIVVVHCGLDAEFYEHTDGTTPTSEHLVSVGRICKDKGQLFLIEAVARLVQDGVDIKLTIVGDGELRQELETRIDELGVRDCVNTTGWLSSEDVRTAMLSARALVHPSFADGLPVVVMEAMALERPVIACRISGTPELVLEGKTGWLVPAGNSDDWVGAMKACLGATEEECQRLGANAKQRVLMRHNADVEASKLAELFGSTASPD